MNKTSNIAIKGLMAAAAAAAMSACDGFIYDYEGDCEPHYKVRFCYDKNMKWADAFSSEVNSVTLYAVDSLGRVVWSRHESGDALAAPGYEMDLPVDPGKYTLMAWCGDGHTSSFTVNDAAHIDSLHCRMGRNYSSSLAVGRASAPDNGAYSDTDLGRLYHSRLDSLDMPTDEGTHYYTMPLTKNTNVVRVMLQQLSGERMEYSDFEFEITDANGHLESDNSLRADELITYRPWSQTNATGNVVFPLPGDEPADLGAVLAEFTVSRLMATSDTRLTVRKSADHSVIFSVPLRKYCLAFKGNHYKALSDQEFLDREDTYNLVFLLDEGMRWMNSYIYINSFQVVIDDVPL